MIILPLVFYGNYVVNEIINLVIGKQIFGLQGVMNKYWDWSFKQYKF